MIRAPRPAYARRFVDQVAVVTGAAGGIGSATAERLAAKGATVWGCDVSADGQRRSPIAPAGGH
jgi:3-oxoacyl-[acyl-carrier protein] reductase